MGKLRDVTIIRKSENDFIKIRYVRDPETKKIISAHIKTFRVK